MKIDHSMALLPTEEMAAKLRIFLRKLQSMMKYGAAPEHIKLGSRVICVYAGKARAMSGGQNTKALLSKSAAFESRDGEVSKVLVDKQRVVERGFFFPQFDTHRLDRR